jgi:hypothetical protein
MKREPRRKNRKPAYADATEAIVNRRSFLEAAGKLALGAAVVTSSSQAMADFLRDPMKKGGVKRVPRPVEVTPKLIHDILLERKKAFKTCFTKAKEKDPTCAGKVVLRVEILMDGKGLVTVRKNTTANPVLAECLVKRVDNWRWPRPGDKEKAFLLPLIFTQQGVEVKEPIEDKKPEHILPPGVAPRTILPIDSENK